MQTDARPWRPNPQLRLHRGINFSNLDVGADAGGFIFVVGTVVTVLIGLPFLAPLYGAALAGGVVVATILAAWHRRQTPKCIRGRETFRDGTHLDYRNVIPRSGAR